MTATSPAPGKTSGVKNHKRRKLAVDPGLAAIVAAVIAAAAGVVGGFIGNASTSGPGPGSAASNPKGRIVNTIVTITPPITGDIRFESTLSGHVSDLQKGNMIWTFFQVIQSSGQVDPMTYPTNGPCTVNFSKGTWACPDVYVGKQKDSGTYRICVAVINFSEARTAVGLDENSELQDTGLQSWFPAPPPYINRNPNSCISVHRIS